MPRDNSCHACGGSGSLECNKCQGAGYITCFKCDGSGHVHYVMRGLSTRGHGIPGGPRFSGGGFRIPEPASINGSQQCNKCDATGKLSCRKCAGTGRVDCRKCGGTGVFQRESHSTFQGSSYQARSSESRVTGTVKFYNRDKGFGFISLDGSGEDIHVSSRNLIGVSELRKGDRVSFESRSGDKGSWAASVEKE